MKFQVVLLQSCQGAKEPGQHIPSGFSYRNADFYDAETTGSVLPSQTPLICQIIVSRPNTSVIAATAAYHSASRKYFLKYMAEQLEQADGVTNIDSMVQLCSKRMTFDMNEECRGQAPTAYSLLRQPLILPQAPSFVKTLLKVNPRNGKDSLSII